MPVPPEVRMPNSSALDAAEWRKSSHSGASGDCVEVAAVNSIRAIRDSKDPQGAFLGFNVSAWKTFVSEIKAGHHDF
jgi:hypothetical protein